MAKKVNKRSNSFLSASAKKRAHKKTVGTAKKPVQISGIRIAQQIPQLVQRKELPVQDVKEIEDELREIINWVAVFEQEYDIPAEVSDTLLKRLHNIAQKVGWLHCH